MAEPETPVEYIKVEPVEVDAPWVPSSGHGGSNISCMVLMGLLLIAFPLAALLAIVLAPLILLAVITFFICYPLPQSFQDRVGPMRLRVALFLLLVGGTLAAGLWLYQMSTQ